MGLMGMMKDAIFGAGTADKLTIYVTYGAKKGGSLMPAGGESIVAQFNPEHISFSKGNRLGSAKVVGAEHPVTTFLSGDTEELSFDLLFDTSMEKTLLGQPVSVKQKYVLGFQKILDKNSDEHAVAVCEIVWGRTLDFTGMLRNMNVNYTMFSKEGIPLRVRLGLTFEKKISLQAQEEEVSEESSDRTKQRTLHTSDHLWTLAAREYEDPGKWRHIADVNGIDNPRILETGKDLIIPPLD